MWSIACVCVHMHMRLCVRACVQVCVCIKNLLLLPGIELWFVQLAAESLYWLPYSSYEGQYKGSASYFF
jgi:hypothetical protein